MRRRKREKIALIFSCNVSFYSKKNLNIGNEIFHLIENIFKKFIKLKINYYPPPCKNDYINSNQNYFKSELAFDDSIFNK